MKLFRRKNLFRNKLLLLFPLILATVFFSWQPLLAVDCSSGVCFPTDTGLSDQYIDVIIENILVWLLGIFGILAIIAFVVSGIQYLASAGNEKAVETAKRHMVYSIVGVAVALSGFIIIRAIDMALYAGSTAF